MNELNAEVNAVLIAGLTPGLRRAVDRLLARGASRAGILTAVRIFAAKAAIDTGDSTRGTLTVAQVSAYLDSIGRN